MIYAIVCNCVCGHNMSAAPLTEPGEPSKARSVELIEEFVWELKEDMTAGRIGRTCPFCQAHFGEWTIGITSTEFQTIEEAHRVMGAESIAGTQKARAAIAESAMRAKPQ